MESSIFVVVIIGACLVGITVLAIYFFVIKPIKKQNKELRATSSSVKKMDRSTARELKNRLDSILVQMTEMIKSDIYHKVIIITVIDWFQGNDSIKTLNDQIKNNVNNRWGFVEQKVKKLLIEFEQYSINILEDKILSVSGELDVKEISNSISQSISFALGAIGTTVVAMISGGAGTALIATGPVGLVIGAIVGVFAFFLGKDAIEKGISDFIADKKIPKALKKSAKKKVLAQLRLNETKFEQEIYVSLKNHLEPVYEVLSSVG